MNVTFPLYLIYRKIYTVSMERKKSEQPEKIRRKVVRKERRLTVRITDPLYEAIENRAYEENKSISTIIVESVIKHLDFKMPPKPD